MSRLRAGRQRVDDAIAERDQADTVPLAVHEIAEGRRQTRGVLEFRDAARAIRHRRTDVDEQLTMQVGFFFVLLDVVAVAARVDLPVHRREIVAGNVLAVFGELDAESFERTAMQAGDEPFDDRAGLELESAEASDHSRIEELAIARRPGHGYIPLFGTGTVSSSRSTTLSALMRSDS